MRLRRRRRRHASSPSSVAAATTSTALAQTNLQTVDATQAEVVPHSPLPAQESVSQDANDASRIDNEAPPTDPDLPGFVFIPGTQTLVRLGGYAKFDAIYDTHPIGN